MPERVLPAHAGPKIAVLDLGSNSFHLLVTQSQGGESFVRIDAQKEMVRLGEVTLLAGAQANGAITGEVWERAMDALVRLAARARSHAPDVWVTVATSAIREARNRDEFVTAARSLQGVDIEVLSGEDEAALVYAGARSALDGVHGEVLVMDVGGGSIELAVGENHECVEQHSLPLGALRLRTAYLPTDGVLTEDAAAEVADLVRVAARDAVKSVSARKPELVILTAGTPRTIAKLAGALGAGVGFQDVLTRDALQELRAATANYRPSQLAGFGVPPRRADTVAVGVVALLTLMEELGVTWALVSDRGMREGVVLRELRRATQGARVAL